MPPTPHAPRRKLMGALIGILLFLAVIAVAVISKSPENGVSTQANEPTPRPTSWISADISAPVMPANPLLADKGAAKYWVVCMACHGDRGQGLTDEWRKRGFGEDMNCWASKCHAANHPPQGFSLVRFIPPAIGTNTLQRFTNAAEVHDYILAKMPWWNPGMLTSDEAWQLTAFLLREDGFYPADREFDPKEAASISVHLPYQSKTNEKTWQWVFAGSLGAILVLLVARRTRWLATKDTSSSRVLPSGVNAELPGSGLTATPSRVHEPGTGSMPGSPAIDPAPLPLESYSPAVGAQPTHPRPNFLHHLHPPSIPLPQARLRYTLGTGGIAVFLCLLLGITGALEMFFYIPTPQQAGASIQVITFLVPFGELIRGLHFWAAQALVVMAAIHLLRILFTGAYAKPRRFNFLLGLGLFVLVLLFDFTGYILRWDEGIRWALLVGTNLVKTIPQIGARLYAALIGGATPGLATITRFYTWHIFGLTLIIAILLVWHLFRVRRDGGISAPPPALRSDARRISRYELVQREVLAMLIAGLILILVSLVVPAPLEPALQAGNAPGQALTATLNEVRAPWFFLWIQQLLRLGDAFWLGVALPLAALVLLAAVPYLFPGIPEEQRGHWFPKAGLSVQIIGAALALGLIILTVLELVTKTP